MSEVQKRTDAELVGRDPARIVAEMPKDAFRSMFFLLTGRPESEHKLLRRRVTVEPKHLFDLHARILEKLRNHHLDRMLVASAELTTEDNTTIKFGSWTEFENFRWNNSKVTSDLRLSWEFLIQTEGFEVPQRHHLTLRMSGGGRPLEFLRAVLNNRDDDDQPIREMAPMVCRIDFVSHVLGRELIAVVEEWNSSLPSPESDNEWIHKIERHPQLVANVVHYSTPPILALLCIAGLRYLAAPLDRSAAITVGDLVMFMQWLVSALLLLFVGDKLALWIAGHCSSALHEHGRYALFLLTSGDFESLKKIRRRNRKHELRFVFAALGALTLNIGAALLTATLWPELTK